MGHDRMTPDEFDAVFKEGESVELTGSPRVRVIYVPPGCVVQTGLPTTWAAGGNVTVLHGGQSIWRGPDDDPSAV